MKQQSVTTLLSNFVVFNLSNNGVINTRIKGTGLTLPVIHIIYPIIGSTFKSEAAKSPPLNSKIGSNEIIKTITSLFKSKFLKKSINA